MFDIDIDIFLDLKKGDFYLTENTLKTKLNVAILTDSLDFSSQIKKGGWINDEIGNNIWLKTYQTVFSPQIRSEIKEEIRVALFDYGSIQSAIINENQFLIELLLENGIVFTGEF